MTTKAYLVSWMGKGNIIWTPLEQASNGSFSISPSWQSPLRGILDAGAANSEVLQTAQRILDPSMAALSSIQSTVTLGVGLAALGVGLQLATLAAIYRVSKKIDRIDQQLKVIGGKFEVHFLDQSVDQFLGWHHGVAGLIPAAAVALEEDCHNALDELIANKNLRLPGYLKLKITSVADAIDSYSRFLYAVIHNGSVPQISDERIKTCLLESRSIQKGSLVGGFVPQRRVLEIWAQQLEDKKWKPDLDDSRLSRGLDRNTIERTMPVVLLAMHLNQALALSASVEEKVLASPECTLIVKTA